MEPANITAISGAASIDCLSLVVSLTYNQTYGRDKNHGSKSGKEFQD